MFKILYFGVKFCVIWPRQGLVTCIASYNILAENKHPLEDCGRELFLLKRGTIDGYAYN